MSDREDWESFGAQQAEQGKTLPPANRLSHEPTGSETEDAHTPQVVPDASVDGPSILTAVESFFTKYLVLPPHCALTVAIWVVATFCFRVFECFAYLAVLSPVKRCGKTRLTEALSLLAANAIRTVNISEAALFRLVDAVKPTLVMDEAEALTGRGERAEAIRALVNSGNRRDAVVPRCVGNSHKLKMFSVYCPKVIVGIGRCPDTVRDRSVMVSMHRKGRHQKVDRFLVRMITPKADDIRGQIKSFVEAHISEITEVYQQLDLTFLEDRDCESWEPLFAVLGVLDPSRLEELKRCSLSLTQRKSEADEDDSLALKLLVDIRAVWPKAQDHAYSRDLLELLKGLEDSPWREDYQLTCHKLARLLRSFGVTSRTVRVGNETGKGYDREDLKRVFSIYLESEASHPSQPA